MCEDLRTDPADIDGLSERYHQVYGQTARNRGEGDRVDVQQ
jgi:hypothetical protein